MPKKILLVEDEKHIARFVELELQHEGYEVKAAFDGREGLAMATAENFDVLLLDVMLPGINGIEICRRIRSQSQVPIILLTARDAVMDRVAGLDAGADDYIVKPFAIEELLARIRTILRRVTPAAANSESLCFRDIEIDVAAYEVFVQGNKLDLTKTEYDLLKLLIEHKNRVCTREHILTSVWGYDTDIETNVVDVYIRHLRTKLPGDMNAYIETVRGVGYVMRE
ncbi:response regulator transcription factor [Lysinibacillus irui]|uniref:Response regulator transcription factor n=1 Tax=Lysinibacillus irui TaxID=2998077 RepID=A0AAJ5UVI0_9BACI|nr:MULTISPECIES: response regulator transcription factor [Lysinibacillus]MEA0553188.1 response regulator transcription factor [Lysinibacillus irui]MEA0562548.1 response regulator transcription factor [Lysinibacillus irui]MEA0975768.1 response regulator transcription factor [Lysinibacillus irui]MEA1041922.1 response regulator transcription factor [Lysinibacillus irui]WDV08919.1 response regulator transcription factor [Lysinibacillus irui]